MHTNKDIFAFMKVNSKDLKDKCEKAIKMSYDIQIKKEREIELLIEKSITEFNKIPLYKRLFIKNEDRLHLEEELEHVIYGFDFYKHREKLENVKEMCKKEDYVYVSQDVFFSIDACTKNVL